jgi:dethiobiotin synthetase
VAITGTDTGVGKTWVGCRLVAALRTEGVDVRAIKLVETGTAPTPQPGEDGVLLARAAGQAAPGAALRRYRAPVAPPDAADMDGAPLDLAAAWDEALELAADADLALLEAAGGLLSPLAWGTTLLDLVAAHRLPTVVVAADRLGTLNHTLLTLATLAAAKVPVPGVVMNALPSLDGDASRGRNATALSRMRMGLPIVETAAPGWEATVAAWLRA